MKTSNVVVHRVDLTDTTGHRIRVTVDLPILCPLPDGSAEIGLPSWTPGSYMIRDYARQLTSVNFANTDAEKIGKDRWRVRVPKNGVIRITYEAFAYERSVRTNWLSDTHAFIAPAALFLDEVASFGDLHRRLNRPHRVEFRLPKGWTVEGVVGSEGAEAVGRSAFVAATYETLVDGAFLAGILRTKAFRAGAKPHRFVVGGPDADRVDLDAVAEDAAKAVAEASTLFGGLPYAQYTFLGYTAPPQEGMGGLEHRDGCALQIPTDATATPERRAAFAGLVAHEHFHAWNVKRLTDATIDAPDLTREASTSMLWFHEGFTSYYDDLLLVRSGVISETAYLSILAELRNTLSAMPGASAQSLHDASIDAWIKFYKKNDEWRSASVSYYAQGALCAAALDLEARASGTGSVDALMRALWLRREAGEPFHESAWLSCAVDILGPRAMKWHTRYVSGGALPPLDALLAPFGVVAEHAKPVGAWAGVVNRLEAGRWIVDEALAGGPAREAGLSPRDEWVAIDGRRIVGDPSGVIAGKKPGAKISVTVFRSDRLVTLTFAPRAHPAPPVTYSVDSKAGATAKRLRKAWLGTLRK